MRINKYISEKGFCSRREADRLISEGRVKIGRKTAVLGDVVERGQTVRVDGTPLDQAPKKIYLAFNKPAGIVCTTDTRVRNNIISFIGHPERIFPIGRLDKDSEGLILLTNDGDVVNRVLRAEHEHQKEYEVELDRRISSEQLQTLLSGVEIFNPEKGVSVLVRAKYAELIPEPDAQTETSKMRGDADIRNSRNAKIVLTQGLNRQVRRMFEAVGFRVVRLQRVRIMHIKLGKLKSGCYRMLSEAEIAGLYKEKPETRTDEARADENKKTNRPDGKNGKSNANRT